MAEFIQCIKTFVNFKNNVATLATVTTVRSACCDKKFSAETYMSVPAFS